MKTTTNMDRDGWEREDLEGDGTLDDGTITAFF
jgi:hypothetical protein